MALCSVRLQLDQVGEGLHIEVCSLGLLEEGEDIAVDTGGRRGRRIWHSNLKRQNRCQQQMHEAPSVASTGHVLDQQDLVKRQVTLLYSTHRSCKRPCLLPS